MTVSTELSHEEYTGNGVTTDFDFRFRIFEAKHLVVSVAEPDGTERILTNGTDYTLRGVGSYRGGKVILKMPLAQGWRIGIARDLPAVQETDLRNQGKFFAEVHEDAFDYLTMLIQKSLGFLSLCLRKPSFISDHYDAKGNKISNLGKPVKDGDAVNLGTMKDHISAKDKRSLRVADKDIPVLPNAVNRANKLLSFDDNGNPVVIVPESGSAADVLAELGKPGGASLIGTFVSIDHIRSFFGEVKESGVVVVVSYHVGKNKGGGLFYYDAGDTFTPDDGGMVIVDSVGRRYKRVVRDFSIENFGGLPENGFYNDEALERIITIYPSNKNKKPTIMFGQGTYQFKEKGHRFGERKSLFMTMSGAGMTATEIEIHSDSDEDVSFIITEDEACEFSDFAVTHFVAGELIYSKLNFIESIQWDNMADNDYIFSGIMAKGLNSVHKCHGRGHVNNNCVAAHCTYFAQIESPDPFVEGNNQKVMSVRTGMRRYVSHGLMVDGLVAVFKFPDSGPAAKYINEVTIHGVNGIYLSMLTDGGYINYASVNTGTLISSLGSAGIRARRLFNANINVTCVRDYDIEALPADKLYIPRLIDIITKDITPTEDLLLDNVVIGGVIGSLNGSIIRSYGKVGSIILTGVSLPNAYEKSGTSNAIFLDIRGGVKSDSKIIISDISFSGNAFPYNRFYWISPIGEEINNLRINHKTVSYGNVIKPKNSGFSKIESGNTAVNIPHGLGFSPKKENIIIKVIDKPSGNIFVSLVSEFSFTVTITESAKVGGDNFYWEIDY